MPQNSSISVLKLRHLEGLLFNLVITVMTSLSFMIVKSCFYVS